MRPILLAILLTASAFAGLPGCGGQPLYTQEESFDIVDCSLAGWGIRSMPRRACLEQNGVPL